ncbi:MAG: excinuclease ABC subunit UvrC [Patescibacteria group bacterium]
MNAPQTINVQYLPQKPGIYQFLDNEGLVLYIGKARRLRSRVQSYFHRSSQLTPHKRLMVGKIKKIEYIITSSETEALLLEANLIKKRQPPFNIDLKDGKTFSYIKITVKEDFPRVFSTRRVLSDGAKYFGPFVSGGSVRQTLNLLRKLFPHRSFQKAPSTSQLEHLTRRYPQLLGPATKEEYRQTIGKIIQFLSGQYREIGRDLQNQMNGASRRREYERAASLRDKLSSIEKIIEKQKVVSPKRENFDIVSIARAHDMSAINLFRIRSGKLTEKQNLTLANTRAQTDGEVLQAFIEQYYAQATDVPTMIILPAKPQSQSIIERAFKTKIHVPQRGIKRQYLNLGTENAESYLELQRASWQRDAERTGEALGQLRRVLKLPAIPRRIEVYDISNVQGADAVGSMIVFTDGKPDKKWYRKFKIKTVSGINDPAMLAEVLGRRFRHTAHEPASPGLQPGWPQPDLLILDGGKGQLSAALKNIPANIPIVALAKQNEDIYLPGRKIPVRMAANSPELRLLQLMRDEAHRFAISFFRSTHRKAARKSWFDEVPGIGPATRKKLLARFGSVQGVRAASREQLKSAVGEKLAGQLRERL